MSIFRPATQKCPNCEAENTFDYFHSVNADRRPDLRDEILSGEFMRVTCTECETRFRFDPDLNYLDSGNKAWVMARPMNMLINWDVEEAAASASFQEAYGSGAPAAAREIGDELIPRVTFGWAGFREKIEISLNGLDDVVVEQMKLTIIQTKPDNPIRPGVELRLVGVYEDIMTFAWITADTNESLQIFEARRELYDAIATDESDDWGELRADLSAGFFVDTQRLFIVPEAADEAASV